MNFTKKTLSVTLLVCFMFTAQLKFAYAADNIPIFVDNVPAYSEVSPFYQNDTLLVPARLISEELGAVVDWQNEQVSISSDDCNIVLYVGQNQAEVNGTSQNLSAPPQIVQGRLFVPLRFIGENLGARVLYRDNKVFLYSSLYHKTIDNTFVQSGDIVYKRTGYNKVAVRDLTTGEETFLPTDNIVTSVLAASRSGLVYVSNWHVMYYSLRTGEIKDYFDYDSGSVETPDTSAYDPHFTDDGKFFFTSLEKNICQSIYKRDIDGTNKKEIFLERDNTRIRCVRSYNGWIYYLTNEFVPKVGYYGGPLYRVREDGTDKQQLSGNQATYYFMKDGLYCSWGYNGESRFWRFEELDELD